ncbi:MAG: hypothetical protein RL186_412 [Pseudomonadota bacterium]
MAGAFGVKGEVRVRSFTAVPEALMSYAPFLHEDGTIALTPRAWRSLKDGIAILADEAGDREQAQALRNTKLFVPRTKLPPAEDDEFYHVDLIGLALEGLDGAPLGKVRAVIPGPQDLLEIEGTPRAKSSWFLPFTKALVPVVDVAGQRLVGDVPQGLIPMLDDPPDSETDNPPSKPRPPTKKKAKPKT